MNCLCCGKHCIENDIADYVLCGECSSLDRFELLVKSRQQRRVKFIRNNVEHTGKFHQWSLDNNDTSTPIPVAIVETDDGKVYSVYVERVTFL